MRKGQELLVRETTFEQLLRAWPDVVIQEDIEEVDNMNDDERLEHDAQVMGDEFDREAGLA